MGWWNNSSAGFETDVGTVVIEHKANLYTKTVDDIIKSKLEFGGSYFIFIELKTLFYAICVSQSLRMRL